MRKSFLRIVMFLILIFGTIGFRTPDVSAATASTKTVLAAPASVKLQLKNYRRVTVKWSAVKKTYRYRVYIKGGKYTRYTAIATTTPGVRSYTTPNLTPGTSYRFVVRAFSADKKAGKLSAAKTIRTLAKMKAPTLTQHSANYVKVSWTSMKGADGYVVSYSLAKDTKRISVTTGSSATYAYIKAKKDVAAYYRVVPYKLVAGKKIYAPWSTYRTFTARRANTWYGDNYVDYKGQIATDFTKGSLLAASTKEEIRTKKKLIIVGASRVVQMSRAVSGDEKVVYIAKSGMGYSWLSTEAYSKLKAWLLLFPNSTVVIQLGNNDYHKFKTDNFNNYASFYKKLRGYYTTADFRFMDILPDQNETYENYALSFNERLHSTFPNNCIGGHDFFLENNLQFLSDGTHYTADASRMIYRYITDMVAWK